MKPILFLVLMILTSCQSKPFYFDSVSHYKIEISENEYNNLLTKEILTKDESEMITFLSEDYMYEINSKLVTKIEKFYPIKNEIKKDHFLKFEEIYQNSFNLNESKCIPIYRDILLFKKNDSVVGLSKICFECDKQFTINRNGKTINFDNSNFDILKKLLR